MLPMSLSSDSKFEGEECHLCLTGSSELQVTLTLQDYGARGGLIAARSSSGLSICGIYALSSTFRLPTWPPPQLVEEQGPPPPSSPSSSSEPFQALPEEVLLNLYRALLGTK